MKLVNPLLYPMPVLIGAIALVVGVRIARLPSIIVVPASVAIATTGAVFRKRQEPKQFNLDNPALEQELQQVLIQAEKVATLAKVLQAEAKTLLTEIHEVELLGTIQYACERACELPTQIEQLAYRMRGASSLLSVDRLQEQLQDAESKIQSSSGIAQEQFKKLSSILQRNIQLAQEGQDTRQAQIVSLSALILEVAGGLQQLQNKLRSADFNDTHQTDDLRLLSVELESVQNNLSVLVTGNVDTSTRKSLPQAPHLSSPHSPNNNSDMSSASQRSKP